MICSPLLTAVAEWPQQPCDLCDIDLPNACLATATEYMCTNFGVDSSSCFPFTAWTHTETDATEHPIPCIGYTGMR